MARIAKIKGILVDLEVLIPITKKFAKYPYFTNENAAKAFVHFQMKNEVKPEEFSPFSHSLKEIYGKDFFGSKKTAWFPNADGMVLIRYPHNYVGDTDGDRRIPGIDHVMLAQDPLRMVGLYCNVMTKTIQTTKTIQPKLPLPSPEMDMSDYIIFDDDWYACYPDGRKEYICPTGWKKTHKRK